MDRRRFAHLSALALASTQVRVSGQSISNSMSATRHVGIAAVGLGSIAEVFMHAVAASSNARITGLVTGHPAEKGVKFGALYNVPKNSIYTYETFGQVRDNPAVDAVYI